MKDDEDDEDNNDNNKQITNKQTKNVCEDERQEKK